MRTADRFVSRQWVFPLGVEENASFLENVAGNLTVRSGPVVVADNVARYVHDRRAGTCLEDYPSLAPPWPWFWIEYPSSSGLQRRGVMVLDTTEAAVTTDLGGDDLPEDGRHIPGLAAGARRHALVADGVDESDVRWVVTFCLFVEQDKKVWGPAGLMSLALDRGGQVLGNRWSVAPWMLVGGVDAEDESPDVPIPTTEEIRDMTDAQRRALLHELTERRGALDGRVRLLRERMERLEYMGESLKGLLGSDEEDDERSTWLVRALAPALQTVAFLHCKNMELSEVVPPLRVQSKRHRSGRPPLLRYHTLSLDVPRRGSAGEARGPGGAPSLHIVAGHFAHYGDCCPTVHEAKGLLFGRLGGVYWVPSHVRGDPVHGEVLTDFELRPV